MMTSTTYFVETEGFQLPDGTIFGAGIVPHMVITRGEDYRDLFKVYYIVGEKRFPASNESMYGKDMKAFVRAEGKYYREHGMKLWAANHSEWSKATYKVLVDENY